MSESLPFAGLHVLELANILAGPLVGQFCAELGAKVIKVEQPEVGDPTRGWFHSEESRGSDVSAYFSCANWGKQSIAIDLARDEGRALVHRLVTASDIVVMSFKPGDESKFGLDRTTLRSLRPDLIGVRVTAYGSQDPRPGFDAIVQAESGFFGLNGESSRPPVKMPVALMDVLAAHQLKEALLLALWKRERTGEGAFVSTSLLASATASLVNQASNYLYAGVTPQRIGSEHPNIAPYGTVFRTSDGHEVVIAVGTERQFQGLTEGLGIPELARDPRFSSNAQRVMHRAELQKLLAEGFERASRESLAVSLTRHKVPFGFVNDIPTVFTQDESQGQLFEDPRGLRTIAWSGDGAIRRDLSPPPALDQDRQAVLAWLNEVVPDSRG